MKDVRGFAVMVALMAVSVLIVVIVLLAFVDWVMR